MAQTVVNEAAASDLMPVLVLYAYVIRRAVGQLARLPHVARHVTQWPRRRGNLVQPARAL